jgi:hypothetical protein
MAPLDAHRKTPPQTGGVSFYAVTVFMQNVSRVIFLGGGGGEGMHVSAMNVDCVSALACCKTSAF